jgi:hypothetical protein
MNFGEAFSFPFQDQDWPKKLIIAAVLMLIPVIGWFIVAGWGLEVIRRVIRREAPLLLPEWTDFGKLIVDGLLIMVIMFIYSLPSTILNGVVQGISVMMQNNSDSEGAMVAVFTVAMVCLGCIVFIYSMALLFIYPAIFGIFAVEGKFASAFQFGKIFAMAKAAPGAFLIALLGSIVASIVGMLGIIACIIGVFFTLAYASLVTYHLYGQAYNEAQTNLGAAGVPVSVPPAV